MKVLVVDDNPEICECVEGFLKGDGSFTIKTFTNPEDVLKEDLSRVDVIIADLNMPEMSGLELLGKAQKVNPKIKSCILSGFPDIDDNESVRVDEIFLKPQSLMSMPSILKG